MSLVYFDSAYLFTCNPGKHAGENNLSDKNKDTQTRSIGFMGQGTEEKK